MFSPLYLLVLSLAPVLAYIAAALVFGVVESKHSRHEVSANAPITHYQDGHSKH